MTEIDFTNEGLNCLKCHHRHHENGNCVAVGGFCTAVPAAYCPLIPELIARAEAAEARNFELEKLLSAVKNMENFYPDEAEFFVNTKKDADDIAGKLLSAEARAEKADSERDAIITAINNGYKVGAITIKDPKFILPGIKSDGWYRTVKEE